MRGGLSLLLLGLPAAVTSRLLGGPDWVTLAAAAMALVPLADWIAVSTEHLTARVGPGIGGFLNVTLANAVELLITVFALRRGLIALVKASITGSIICNTLLVLGISAFLGGIRHGSQKVTLFASTAIFAYISLDGESNWLEGAQLVALYLIAAVVFFFFFFFLSR